LLCLISGPRSNDGVQGLDGNGLADFEVVEMGDMPFGQGMSAGMLFALVTLFLGFLQIRLEVDLPVGSIAILVRDLIPFGSRWKQGGPPFMTTWRQSIIAAAHSRRSFFALTVDPRAENQLAENGGYIGESAFQNPLRRPREYGLFRAYFDEGLRECAS
jgi:hypothetical protein